MADVAADADRKIESVERDNGHWYTLSNVCSRGRMETSRARPLVARPGSDSSPEKPDARASLIDRGDGDVKYDGNYGTTHGWLRRGDQTAGAGDVSALLGTVRSRTSILWISEHVDLLGDPRLGPEPSSGFCRAGSRSTAMQSTLEGWSAGPWRVRSATCRFPAPCSKWSHYSSRSWAHRQAGSRIS